MIDQQLVALTKTAETTVKATRWIRRRWRRRRNVLTANVELLMTGAPNTTGWECRGTVERWLSWEIRWPWKGEPDGFAWQNPWRRTDSLAISQLTATEEQELAKNLLNGHPEMLLFAHERHTQMRWAMSVKRVGHIDRRSRRIWFQLKPTGLLWEQRGAPMR